MNTLRRSAELNHLPELLETIEALSRAGGLDEAVSFKAKVVLEELFVNVASYAYPEGPGPVEIGIQAEPQGLCMRIQDWGAPFNPLEQEAPDMEKRFAAGLPGGAGLLLVKGMASVLRYERCQNSNIIEVLVTD